MIKIIKVRMWRVPFTAAHFTLPKNCFLDYSAIRHLAFASNCFCNLAAHYGVSEVTGSIRSRSFHPAENPKKNDLAIVEN